MNGLRAYWVYSCASQNYRLQSKVWLRILTWEKPSQNSDSKFRVGTFESVLSSRNFWVRTFWSFGLKKQVCYFDSQMNRPIVKKEFSFLEVLVDSTNSPCKTELIIFTLELELVPDGIVHIFRTSKYPFKQSHCTQRPPLFGNDHWWAVPEEWERGSNHVISLRIILLNSW